MGVRNQSEVVKWLKHAETEGDGIAEHQLRPETQLSFFKVKVFCRPIRTFHTDGLVPTWKRLFQPLVQMWQMVTRINPDWTLDETRIEEIERCCDPRWRLVACTRSFISSGPCRGSTWLWQGGSSPSRKPELTEVQLPSEVDLEDWRCPRPLGTDEPWEEDQDSDLLLSQIYWRLFSEFQIFSEKFILMGKMQI